MIKHLVSTAALASALLAAAPALPQGAPSGQGSPPSGQDTSQGARQPGTAGDSQRAEPGTTSPDGIANRTDRSAGSVAPPSTADRKFLSQAAEASLLEIQRAQIAQQKAMSPEVKSFAKQIADDHTKATSQLSQVAQAEGVMLPQSLSRSEQNEINKLNKLSGAKFDKEYVNEVVSDHKKVVDLFQTTAKRSKDSELQTFAASTVATLQTDLNNAKDLQKRVKNEK